MHCTRKVTDNIIWVGGTDRRLHLFENLFPIPRGITYNSYVILDEKTALMDTVDSSISKQFMENVAYTLNERELDYVVVNHVEPDHCAELLQIINQHPETKIVGNQLTIQMIRQFFDKDLSDRVIIVSEGEELCLGSHTLQFVMAPMVHWPEVMMCYEKSEKILFSADAFGTFGALSGGLFSDEYEFEKEWLEDARRYYTNIVGKYGMQVQNVLKKASGLDIQMIAPLHGPVWRSNLGWFIDKYDKWSRYDPEDQSVLIVYGSIYGNTENAMNIIANKLSERGVRNIKMYDVSNTHISELISESFRCSHILLAAPTYNSEVFPPMQHYLSDLKNLKIEKRKIAVIDNGTWALTGGKLICKQLETMKDITLLKPCLNIKSTLKEEELPRVDELVEQIYTTL